MEKKRKNPALCKKENSVTLGIMTAILVLITVCNQGGYFPGAVAAAGIFEILLCILCGKNINKISYPALVFCVWYFFCAVRTGLTVEYALRGLIPLTCFLFYLSVPRGEAKKIIGIVIRVSVLIAVCSIIHCAFISFKAMQLKRGLFPFQYSNASGIYFAVMFLLSKGNEGAYLKRARWIFAAALLLTQSVGALLLAVAGELLLDFNIKKVLIISAGAAILCILFRARLYESVGTFTERLLQIYDGTKCIIQNPVCGIGAGQWENAKFAYQSGFYRANTIHSSLVQIGVNSGIPGLCMFLLILLMSVRSLWRGEKKYFVCAGILLLHSCIDFTLSFPGLDMLLILLLVQRDDSDVKPVSFGYKAALLLPAAVIFVVLSAGMYKAAKTDEWLKRGEFSRLTASYEEDYLFSHSHKGLVGYGSALYAQGNYEKLSALTDGIEYPPSELSVLRIRCCENSEVMLEYLQRQPYNTALYEEIKKSGDERTQLKADEIFEASLNNMSYPGKLLYEKKGRNY